MFGTVKTVVSVEGMMCEHCAAHVKEALEKIEGVKSVVVSLKTKEATVKSGKKLDENEIKTAIENAGYKCVGVK